MTLLNTAQEYLTTGLSVLPARRKEKRPAISSWKEFQKQLPTATHVAAWFANEQDALCVICGQVSGNLEVLDFDQHGELFDAWLAAIPQELCDRLVVEQTPSGGYHVAYRCPEGISGNLKLAVGLRDGKRMTLIETRGEGGLVLCAPTEGYQLMQGDYTHLGALSSNERITLLDAAWRFNEHTEETKSEKQASEDTRFTLRPGDDYNARGDFQALLQAHGWVYLRTLPDGNQHWRRPGKEGDHTSATLKDGSFYVFSSNAAPFEPVRSYNAFGAYTLMEHGGDHAKAASELSRQGYGQAAEKHPGVDLSGILGQPVEPVVHLADPEMVKPGRNHGGIIIPDEPEIILPWRKVSEADVARAVEGTLLGKMCELFATVTDPPLPISAVLPKALVICGAALSRKMPTGPQTPEAGNLTGIVGRGPLLAMNRINTGGGQGCNFYTMLVAPSSSGKDIGNLLEQLAMECQWYLGDAGSAEGLADAYIECPNGVLCISELQNWLDKKNWQHNAIPFLNGSFNKGFFKQNFSSRGGKSSLRQTDYCYPNILACVQPDVLFRITSKMELANGFLGRFLFSRMSPCSCMANVFDLYLVLSAMMRIIEVFKLKTGRIDVPKGYSYDLWQMFDGRAPDEIDFCWKRLAGEYYPRFAVALSITDDFATQGAKVILTQESWDRAAVLVKWFFSNAEKLLLNIDDETEQRVKNREETVKKVCRKILKLDRGNGVTISQVSQSGIRNTNGKERHEAIMELVDRGVAMKTEDGRYTIVSCPHEWAE